MNQQTRVCVVALFATVIVTATEPTFTSVWKTPIAFEVSLANKKVAALVISKDEGLRIAGEEALARELTSRGLQGVATYRIAPREELAGPETARPWFERAGIEGVVALRPVSSEKRATYSVETWENPYYGSLWRYYGYGWGNVVGRVGQETTVVVETTIYSVPRDALLWAGVSETRDPKQLASFINDLAKAIVSELHRVGLAKQTQK